MLDSPITESWKRVLSSLSRTNIAQSATGGKAKTKQIMIGIALNENGTLVSTWISSMDALSPYGPSG
eukprot:COSAG02_NODE_50287_length_321_cov_1.018018_1_plen_66_part_10